jgi:hypothetical protein
MWGGVNDPIDDAVDLIRNVSSWANQCICSNVLITRRSDKRAAFKTSGRSRD